MIWFDLDNTPHVPLFRPVLSRLRDRGVEVVVTSRPFAQTEQLLQLWGIDHLPGGLKLRGLTHKYIHKKAVDKWLPKEIIARKKRGFATPMDEWLQKDLAANTKQLLNDKTSASRRYFNLPYINEMLELHQKRRENFEKQIFTLLSFEVWHRTFFDPQPVNFELEGSKVA